MPLPRTTLATDSTGGARPIRSRACLHLAAFLLASCGGGAETGDSQAIVLDSAGVRIVTHPASSAPPRWTADVAGGLALPGDFFQVTGAVVHDDGTIVVADGGSRTLRRFGPEGEPMATVGGPGEGPGEFQGISLVAPYPGDSLLVFDLNLRRVSIFGPDGSFGRSFQLQASDEAPFGNVRGVHRDGSLLATGFSQTPQGGPEDGRHWYSAPIFVYGPDGAYRSTLSAQAGGESYFERFNGGGFTVFMPLFGRSTFVVAGPEILVVASNDRWDLRFFTPEGALTHRVRLGDGPPPPVTDALRGAAVERLIENATSNREPADLRRIYEGMEVPPTLPAHARVAVDRLDHVWVERYVPAPEPDSEWLVFEPDGDLAAQVELPALFTPHVIGEDFLLGVLRDELDVEQVIRIGLKR
jgi:hypothetical protein